MKNVVIAGSVSLPTAVEKWVRYWSEQNGHLVTNYPKPVSETRFLEEYPQVHKDFFASLRNADILFVANEEKHGIPGYIGAEVFAEIAFAVALNLIADKHIEIILAQKPAEQVQAYEEIQLWSRLGWIHFHTFGSDPDNG